MPPAAISPIGADPCEQLNEQYVMGSGTHSIAEDCEGGRRRPERGRMIVPRSDQAQRDDSWFCHSAVSFNHHGGQCERERYRFPLFHPRQGSEPHQDGLRASAARSRAYGRSQIPSMRNPHTREIRMAGGKALIGLVGVQSNQFPRAVDLARCPNCRRWVRAGTLSCAHPGPIRCHPPGTLGFVES